MIKFGPSGFCDDFSKVNKSTEDMPQWLLEHNLEAYELSFTNGVRLSDETAEKFGKLFQESNIEVSVHAPYFINFANPNKEQIVKSNMYIISCLQKMKFLKAKKLVFHSGTQMKMTREEAFENTYKNIKELLIFLMNMVLKIIICAQKQWENTGKLELLKRLQKFVRLMNESFRLLILGI